MTPEEFRLAGYALIDWIAEYRTSLPERPVMTTAEPGEVRALLSSTPPTTKVEMAGMLADLNRVVVPNMTAVQHPSYLGFFPANASLASVLGDLASGGLGGLGISWQSCPALTEVEEVVVDWMRQLVGLSDSWKGTIQDTASTATLVAMVCARERASDFSARRGGIAGAAPVIAYASDQAHSSIAKGALVAGYGEHNLRILPTCGPAYAMDPIALDAAMAADTAAGLVPAIVVAAVGATATTAMDPVDAIAEVAARHGAWLHIDAAMAGTAMLLPEMRYLWQGVERADSITWNPHKWMGTILDTSLYYVRDTEQLVTVLATDPSYLQSPVDGLVTQYRDWGIPLGRRFRALKLWFHLALDGVEAITARVRRDLDNAAWLASEVASSPNWHVLAPVPLQTVCVRHEPSNLTGDSDAIDRHTIAWANAVNRSGVAFVTPSKLEGRWMVRLSVGAEPTERHHVEAAWSAIRAAAEER